MRAPKAAEVTLYGDWMPIGHPEPMTKTENGVWTISTAPPEANGHLYWFNLDGLAIPDPINPIVKLRQRTSCESCRNSIHSACCLGIARRSSRYRLYLVAQ